MRVIFRRKNVLLAMVLLLFRFPAMAQPSFTELFEQGMALKSEREYQAGYALLDSAARVAAKDKSWADWAEARIKAGTCLGQEGLALEAIHYFEATRAELPEKFEAKERQEIQLRLAKSLAYYYERLNAIDLAIRFYLEVLQIQEETGASEADLARSCLNLGAVMSQKNDLVQAKAYLERGLNHSADNPAYQSKFWTNLGMVALGSGKPQDAMRAFQEAFRLRSEHAGKDPEEMAGVHLFLASAAHAAGENEAASNQLRLAHRFLLRIPESHDLWGDYCSQLAGLRAEDGDYSGALLEGDKAVAHFSSDPDLRRELAVQLIDNGTLRLKVDSLSSAESNFQAALELFLPEHQSRVDKSALPALDSLQTEPWVIEALKGLAEAAFLDYKKNPGNLAGFARCIDALSLAVEQASIVRRALVSSEARLGLSGKVYELFETAIVRALEMAKVSGDDSYLRRAFAFAEQGKAAVLLEEIAVANNAGGAGLPAPLRDSLDALELSYRVYRSTGPSTKADSALSELGELMIDLRERYPSYFAARYQAQPISIDTVQQRLLEQEAVVEYFVGDESLVVFLITRDSFMVFRNDLPLGFNSTILALRKSITSSGSSQSLKDFRRLGHELYLQVAEQFVRHLPEQISAITVVPDGLLGYLPFEVLLSADPGTKGYAELPYLIRDYRFSYAYSATLRYHERRSMKVRDARVLACALSFSGNGQRLERGSPDRQNLAGLPHAIPEAKAIGAKFEGSILLDEAATESAFRKQAPEYEILHLATHTIFNDSSPDATRIVFAEENEEQDGYLHAYELYGLNLHADLAVLSACQTGDGELLRGEGVMSLGRAFTYAGCRSTVMTLWPLNDEASGAIMGEFYRYLAKGLPKDEALHRAKLDYLESQTGPKANPFYWAPFIQTGDTSPVAKTSWVNTAYRYAPVGGVPLLLLILLLFFRRRARRAKAAAGVPTGHA